MEIQTGSLPNGIRIIHQQIALGAISHIGLFINVGSRDEDPDERGIAHFLEHALFKGTQKRKAYHILNRLDVVGGELNAYTTKEETCVYASVLNEHLDRAIELISDITFHSTFPEHELLKEKEVVIDEILSYQDSPAELIFEEFDNYLFQGSSLGYDILGSEEDIRKIRREKIIAFVKKHYVPKNMVLSYVGNLPLKIVVKKLSKYFERYPSQNPVETRKIVPNSFLFKQNSYKETHQCHSIIGCTTYSYNHPKRTAMVMLNNFLGGPAMNSKLNMEIREKYGYAYTIDSSYQPYTDTGIFCIYFGTDVKNLEKTKTLIQKEVKKIKEKEFTTLQLHQAKQQLKGFIALGLESKVGLMLGLGKSYLISDKVDTIAESLAKIDALTSKELLEVANETFSWDNMSDLTYLSKS